MALSIQVSAFDNGSFPSAIAEVLRAAARAESAADGSLTLAFVASEFEQGHEKTDKYFAYFCGMFEDADIHFTHTCVVDARMSAEEMQKSVAKADIVWISGGWTPTEWAYLEKYGLVEPLRKRTGITIGMSAGAINMAEIAASTETLDERKLLVYPGLGLAPTTVEPHFDKDNIAPELVELSYSRVIYGLCDEGAIIHKGGEITFIGDVYRLENGAAAQISFAE